MRYFKKFKDDSPEFEISQSDAFKQLAEAYGEGAEDIIQTPGCYNLPFSIITVVE